MRHGNLDCIKVLIRAGANVNSINAGGHTPLHEAAYRGYEDTIKMLLLHGANPHATSNQRRTPLHEACMQGTSHKIKWRIIQKHSDIWNFSSSLQPDIV